MATTSLERFFPAGAISDGQLSFAGRRWQTFAWIGAGADLGHGAFVKMGRLRLGDVPRAQLHPRSIVYKNRVPLN